MSFVLGENSKIRYETLSEKLRIIIDRALRVSLIDFGIAEGYRSPEIQFEYFKRGRELIEGVWEIIDESKVITYLDGYKKKSKHNHKPTKAFDFYVWVPGHKELMYDKNHMIYLGMLFTKIAEQLDIKVTWGGTWNEFKDYPHIQLV